MTILILDQISQIDQLVSQFVQRINLHFLESYLFAITYLGNLFPIFLILTLSSLYFYSTSHRKAAIYLLTSTAVGVGLSTILKLVVARPRPTADLVNVLIQLNDYSFPSTHCLSFTIIFGFLYFYLTQKKRQTPLTIFLKALFLFLILTISISRIYLGVHWLSDCLAGYLLGLAVLLITIKKFKQ